MADADPNITSKALEGSYSVAREIAESYAALPPIGPPAPPYGTDRLVLIHRSVLVALIEHEVEAVTLAIGAVDDMDSDPDVEANGDELDGTNAEDEQPDSPSGWNFWNGPGCVISDPDGPSTPEWHTLGRHKAAAHTASLPHEDAEEDNEDEGVEDGPRGFDPEEDMCLAGDDRVCSGAVIPGPYGNKHEGPGDADDAEHEYGSLPDDVPCLAVYSLEPNAFTGKREYLGHSNLKPSFVSGRPMKDADNGMAHQSTGWGSEPVAPV